MNRRKFLGLLSILPFLSFLKPKELDAGDYLTDPNSWYIQPTEMSVMPYYIDVRQDRLFYVDFTSCASDENDGLSLDRPLKTIARARELATQTGDGIIVMSETDPDSWSLLRNARF